MINSFRGKYAEQLYQRKFVKRFSVIERQALTRLRRLDAATQLGDLGEPLSNRFEALQGDRSGQYSIRINGQWRICFRWDDGPYAVEIVDYH